MIDPHSSGATDAASPDAASLDAASPDADANAATGATLTVRVRTSTAPFPQNDGWSGQTTRQTKQGVRAFRLLRSSSDPSPVIVFDHGAGFVEAGYDDGDDTVIGTAPLASIPPGTYTIAQSVVTHSRYIASSTMHYAGLAYPGDFDCVQALSDGTLIDGVVRAKGWFRYVFSTSGQSFPLEGANAPLPTQAQTGGFTMKENGGETYYEVPALVVVPQDLSHDVTIIVDVNMNAAFRWEDQALPGYLPGVYDTTPTSMEPVRRYGANSYTLTVE